MKEVTIIAGATGGLGSAVTREASRRGNNLILIAKDANMLDQIKNEILQKTKDIKIIYYVVDITKTTDEEIRQIFSEIYSKYERIDHLINCTGIGGWWPIEDTSLQIWNDIININVTGAFLLCKHATVYMKKQNRGVIINVSSIAGKKGAPYASAYCASKFSLVGLSYALSEELNKYGIKVIVVIPGGIDTDFVRKALSNSSSVLASYIKHNYLQCNGMKAQQVAKIILSLLDLPEDISINELIVKRSFSGVEING